MKSHNPLLQLPAIINTIHENKYKMFTPLRTPISDLASPEERQHRLKLEFFRTLLLMQLNSGLEAERVCQ
jgi:hypothetical protein